MKRKAIFLDRDGVINRVLVPGGKPMSPRRFEDFRVRDGVGEALNAFRALGFLNIIITNQPDISRGLMETTELAKMHDYLTNKLPIDDIFVCPHDDKDGCDCRKPKPGLIRQAEAKLGIDLKASYVIGDTQRDMGAGSAAGCRTALLITPYNKTDKCACDFKINSLTDLITELKK